MDARLLLVEDDPEIARVIRDAFSREGYEVTWATTGLEGWEDFLRDTFDLVLVDLMLPEMDGFTLCRNIRWKSDIPLLIISARTEDEDKVKGLVDIGADDYVQKPFSITELKARVESAIKRWHRYKGTADFSDTTVYDNGLMINWEQQKVFVDAKEKELTVKEFELLKLLTQHPNRIFSKSELYQHVWLQVDANGLHTVTVHVKSLREKLGDPVKSPRFVQTVWGKGYRFIGEPT
ncbi:response regulator transcription factor [Halalkalibacter oceani]|uniref:Response regulator transcription factor n=1 Tax=Halalkalibacter oceani TaxID=1653776 RepID=A0A9X2DUM3_9BACI|nr:response regulator transcription factor [Halalkalibacter oceani]MCM3715753.1 response regulator transcription factor [Halalkalibacter oceani]